MSNILHLQLPLRPALPTVYGPLCYREKVTTFKRIDSLLQQSGIETELVAELLRTRPGGFNDKVVARMFHAFRCCIAMKLTGMDARAMASRLADSALLQWFTYCGDHGVIAPSSKSSLDRYLKLFDRTDLSNAVDELTAQAADADAAKRLGALNAPLALDDVFADCTCVKVNIHFPTDWVLLVDAVKTLMQSIRLIRSQGLRHRMPDPELFLRKANKMAIAMCASRRGLDARRKRKKTLRGLKNLNRLVARHARTYRELLDREWSKTDWTRKQANQVLARMDNILEKLPAAIHQAHERIIGERKVHNADKMLSLYEEDVHVIVRGKAGAEVEFGNKLYVAEQRNGVLVDWEYFKDEVPADTALVQRSVERMKDTLGKYPEGYVTDRGFAKQQNKAYLEEKGIRDGLCARDPAELRERMKEVWYADAQKRRGSTEGRIGVFKNVFLKRVMREKGSENREQSLVWCVLAHNLWVLARMSLADEAERKAVDQAA
jgi:hypothetical protein